jgi:hypothetical protein
MFLFSLPQDASFSCVVTALFLRPIFEVLGQVGQKNRRSVGQLSLEKTKWLTLAGSSLAVVSSTALYINGGLWVVLGDYGQPFYANPYLHVMVFGINLDSVVNDVGMLLACGVLKKITYESVQGAVQKCMSTFRMVAPHKVEVEPDKSWSYHSKSGSGGSKSDSGSSNSSSGGSETEADGQPVTAHSSTAAAYEVEPASSPAIDSKPHGSG